MDKSQGRIQAGAAPVRRGRGGTLYFRGGTLCYVVKCPGGHFTTGDRLLRDSPARPKSPPHGKEVRNEVADRPT